MYSEKNFEQLILMKTTIENTLKIANLLGMKSIALPVLQSGIYHFPAPIITRMLFDETVKLITKS